MKDTLWTDADWARSTRCPAVHPGSKMQCKHRVTGDKQHQGCHTSDRVDGGKAGVIVHRW